MIILKDAFLNVIVKTRRPAVSYGKKQKKSRSSSPISLPSLKKLTTSFDSQTVYLHEKLNELETVCDSLCEQASSLQSYFDARHSEATEQQNGLQENILPNDEELFIEDDFVNIHLDSLSLESKQSFSLVGTSGCNRGIDFRGEAITFKVTAAYMIQMLSHCIEAMVQSEEEWKSKLANKEEKFVQLINYLYQIEGKTEVLKHAIEGIKKDNPLPVSNSIKLPSCSQTMNPLKHRMSDQIKVIVMKNVQKVKENANIDAFDWHKIYEKGNLHVYRREHEVDGVVCDPLKTHHIIMGVTAHEVCYYFFQNDAGANINESVAQVNCLETLSENTVIYHKIFKRIWPSTQRDTCFVSHIQQLDEDMFDPIEKEVRSPWIVTNTSTDHKDAENAEYIRVLVNVTLICQTFTIGQVNNQEYTRENIGCRLIHMSEVHPGGRPPSAIVRQVVKREYPKFLNKFFSFVQTTTKDKPLML